MSKKREGSVLATLALVHGPGMCVMCFFSLMRMCMMLSTIFACVAFSTSSSVYVAVLGSEGSASSCFAEEGSPSSVLEKARPLSN